MMKYVFRGGTFRLAELDKETFHWRVAAARQRLFHLADQSCRAVEHAPVSSTTIKMVRHHRLSELLTDRLGVTVEANVRLDWILCGVCCREHARWQKVFWSLTAGQSRVSWLLLDAVSTRAQTWPWHRTVSFQHWLQEQHFVRGDAKEQVLCLSERNQHGFLPECLATLVFERDAELKREASNASQSLLSLP